MYIYIRIGRKLSIYFALQSKKCIQNEVNLEEIDGKKEKVTTS